jgi:ABC-type phosphate/phosphonate transport system substrate-binding protein
MRAGWVDRWSAAGFVLPRVNLALLGIDPRTFFRTETFHGSHRAVIRALVEGSCDVAGTYAQVDKKGKVTASAWSEVEGADVRVLATFGAIPPDVIAARKTLGPGVQTKIWEALGVATQTDDGKRLLSAVFGGDGLQSGLAKSYDSLSLALDMATKRGLFD